MSVLNITKRRAGPFAGNGTTVLVMPFPFLVYSSADVLVTAIDVNNLQTTLVLGTDYTVVLNADQVASPGCVVTTTAVIAATMAITLTSALANTINVQVAGAAAAPINSGFDRLAILIQQLAEWVSRCAVIPVGGIGSLVPASLVFGVGLDGSGNPIPVLSKLANITLATVSTFMASFLSSANAAGAQTTLGISAYVQSLLVAANAAAARATLGLVLGTGPNNVVQLNGTSQLPAVDGALLANITRLAVRQTVISGPTSAGAPNFGGATGSAVVTATGTLIATAAQGQTINGGQDVIGSITNPSWTGLSTNGTMYLFLDIAGGVCTPASSTLQPVYEWGGTPAVTNGLLTFNIQEMQGYVGNGATAPAAARVCVGEVTVAGNVVTAITWYALSGRYVSADTAWPGLATPVSVSHNLGLTPFGSVLVEAVCQTAELGYTASAVSGPDVVVPLTDSGAWTPLVPWKERLTCGFTTGNTTYSIGVVNKTTGATTGATVANWKYRITVNRGW